MATRISFFTLFVISLPFIIGSELRDPKQGLKGQTQNENPVVRVEQGLLRGRRMESAAGGSFFSFQGVPYAQPPIGQLRFKDAQPPQSWVGVRNATSHGEVCPQPFFNFTGFVGDEDCLFLNVYTPLQPGSQQTRLPVMFWIHGGGFTLGHGNTDLYGPDYLVSENVIVVTINYRLGAFGYLYLNEAAPGNAGMKDQVAALRWVRRNIAAFGGDPDKITIFGESSGGSSVHFLMLSPMTKGLFSAAITQSGHGVYEWRDVTPRLEFSLRLASAVGCDARASPSAPGAAPDAAAIVDCLRDVNASTLVASTLALVNATEQLLSFAFLPTVDMEVSGVERFLPASPEDLVKKGLAHPVPYIIGFNQLEASDIFSSRNLYDEDVARQLDKSWNTTILPMLRLPSNSSLNEEALQKIREFFMEGKPLTNQTIQGFLDLLSDIIIAEGTYYTLRAMARHHRAPFYEYSFIVDDELNINQIFSPVNYTGAGHADDLGYLFRMDALPEVPANSSAALARSRMVQLWTNFSKHGVPTSTPDQLLLGVNWKPYTARYKNFLEIGDNLRLGRDLNSARVEFWEKFYNTYSPEKTHKR